MIKLRQFLNNQLKSIHPTVYFRVAPSNATFPYAVYDLPNSFASGDQEILTLDVDVWDSPINGDTTTIEQLASQIWKGINNLSHIDEHIQLNVYRENRLTLTDDDSRIQRRKLIFSIRYFDRGLNDG